MSAEGHVLEKSDSSKSLIKYILVLAVFLGALWLSFQNDGPSKFPKQITDEFTFTAWVNDCLLYTSPSPRDQRGSRMPSSA